MKNFAVGTSVWVLASAFVLTLSAGEVSVSPTGLSPQEALRA